MSDLLVAQAPARREAPERADLAVARRVIRAEIDGLQSLATALDDRFERAVAVCAAAHGRIIVTGIGKSGHVGRKIAAGSLTIDYLADVFGYECACRELILAGALIVVVGAFLYTRARSSAGPGSFSGAGCAVCGSSSRSGRSRTLPSVPRSAR